MLGMFIMLAVYTMAFFLAADNPARLEFTAFIVANVFTILAATSEWRLRCRIATLESKIETKEDEECRYTE